MFDFTRLAYNICFGCRTQLSLSYAISQFDNFQAPRNNIKHAKIGYDAINHRFSGERQ